MLLRRCALPALVLAILLGTNGLGCNGGTSTTTGVPGGTTPLPGFEPSTNENGNENSNGNENVNGNDNGNTNTNSNSNENGNANANTS